MTLACLEPISLGSDCSQKFQISRALYRRAHPQGSLDRLREAFASGEASRIFRRLPFDAQITPIEALVAYLEQDFQGVFERQDLIVHEDGYVVHRQLGTQHPHEFHPVDGRLDEAAIDAQYPRARSKFDHLAAKFRALLNEPGPFLYVRGEVPCRRDAISLVRLLSARGPGHRFRLLFTGEQLRTDLDDIDERISQDLIQPSAGKPEGLRWEGDDDSWDRALAPFDLGLPRGPAFTANFNIVQEMTGPPLQALTLEWGLQPETPLSTALPRTFDLLAIPWAFAALSEPVHALSAAGARTVVIEIEALAGEVGVGLVRMDGSAMIGREYRVSPDDGRIALTLPLAAGLEPARIVLRTHGDAGLPGSVRLYAVGIEA